MKSWKLKLTNIIKQRLSISKSVELFHHCYITFLYTKCGFSWKNAMKFSPNSGFYMMKKWVSRQLWKTRLRNCKMNIKKDKTRKNVNKWPDWSRINCQHICIRRIYIFFILRPRFLQFFMYLSRIMFILLDIISKQEKKPRMDCHINVTFSNVILELSYFSLSKKIKTRSKRKMFVNSIANDFDKRLTISQKLII